MADVTPKDIFETKFKEKLTENPNLAKEVNAVILFDLKSAILLVSNRNRPDRFCSMSPAPTAASGRPT